MNRNLSYRIISYSKSAMMTIYLSNETQGIILDIKNKLLYWKNVSLFGLEHMLASLKMKERSNELGYRH